MLAVLLALLPAMAAPHYARSHRVQCPLSIDGNPDEYVVYDAVGKRVTAYGFGNAVGDTETVARLDDETTKRAAEGGILLTAGGIAMLAWGVGGAVTTVNKADRGKAFASNLAIGAANGVPFVAVGLGILLSPRRLRPDAHWTFDDAEWFRHDCGAGPVVARPARVDFTVSLSGIGLHGRF